MRYQITGKQIDIGEALQVHVKTELGEVIDKYAERPTDANVVFSKSGHEYVCESEVHLSTGLTAQAKARETEIYAAFDSCSEKMEKQLRRYKRRLKDHHRDRPQPVEQIGASSYILESNDSHDENEPDSLQPMIIAEMETKIPSLSVGEAVMLDALLDRETLGPTGVGNGIALPHARLEGLDSVVSVFVRLEKPMDFGAVDRQPVDLIFALFAPQNAGVDHLKALALVSRTLRDSSICAKLRANSSTSTLHTILTEGPASQAA